MCARVGMDVGVGVVFNEPVVGKSLPVFYERGEA